MYKASIDLGRVNPQISVKFNMILDDGDVKTPIRLVNKFSMRGNTYLTINPHPWITIDINGRHRRSDDSYDPNNTVALTRPYVINVCRMIERAIESMSTEDLFFYKDRILHINKEVATRCLFKTCIKNGKYIAMCPMVVNDKQDQYEGLGFLINTTSNYASMTLDEAEYLLDLLRGIDMYSLSMQLINTAIQFKGVDAPKIVKPEALPIEITPVVDKRLHLKDNGIIPDIK